MITLSPDNDHPESWSFWYRLQSVRVYRVIIVRLVFHFSRDLYSCLSVKIFVLLSSKSTETGGSAGFDLTATSVSTVAADGWSELCQKLKLIEDWDASNITKKSTYDETFWEDDANDDDADQRCFSPLLGLNLFIFKRYISCIAPTTVEIERSPNMQCCASIA